MYRDLKKHKYIKAQEDEESETVLELIAFGEWQEMILARLRDQMMEIK